MKEFCRLLPFLLVLSLIMSCDDDPAIVDMSETFVGEETAYGNGNARVWFSQDSIGNPSELAISLSSGALENLPPEDPNDPFSTWRVIDFPDEALEKTAFRFMLFSWNQHGHGPTGIYTLPHFDFHFYMQSNDERMQIPPFEQDSSKFLIDPPMDQMPTSYIKVPGGVPTMGSHWVDSTSDEFNGEVFDYTFLFGSYDGDVTFYEPMITLDVLQNIPPSGMSIDIKQPTVYETPGLFYPMKYEIKEDASSGEITVSMTDFVLR